LGDDFKDPRIVGEDQGADEKSRNQEPADKVGKSSHMRRLAIRSLLENSPVGVDDKLTTVKVAHHVDKDRFQSAFRSLMRDTKP
jgi:hypothetical protein